MLWFINHLFQVTLFKKLVLLKEKKLLNLFTNVSIRIDGSYIPFMDLFK